MTTKSKKTVEKLEKSLSKSTVVDSAEQFELLIERVKKAFIFQAEPIKEDDLFKSGLIE